MRIVLFTPFSPEIGGGSVQFRSLLPELHGLEIEWFYLAGSAVAGPQQRWLGQQFTTGQFLSEFCGRTGFLPGATKRTRQFVERMEADLYWVVAHGEGVLVAEELCRRGKRVHLTVHDDPVSMFEKSRKFWALAPLMERQFAKLLSSVGSVDVISPFMRDAYKQKYGIDSIPVYRHVRELLPFSFLPTRGTLTVGHIGSVYDPEPFRRFVMACREYAVEQNRALKLVRIGSSPEIDAIAAENATVFENRGEMDEEAALPILANCDFVYAMYPEGKRYEGFRRTSLPMKISTYVQAQRPIFAHTPEDSTLAWVVGSFSVGQVCCAQEHSRLKESIGKIVETRVTREQFELLRKDLMGESQVEELRRVLTSGHFQGI